MESDIIGILVFIAILIVLWILPEWVSLLIIVAGFFCWLGS